MKRQIILLGGVAGLVAPLPGRACTSPEEMQVKQPNVIFIIADDLGYGDISCYGQKKFKTPAIDRLALNGMRFTQCYAGTTVSAPSRCSLVTGLHTGHTAIRGNKEEMPEGQSPLPGGTPTIFTLFKQAGYTTGAFGKWGLGFPGSEGAPENQGVDEFFGYNCQRMAHNYYPDHLWHNEKRVALPENDNGGFGMYSQDLIQEYALRFMEDNKEKPFFMFVPCVLPHAELLVPEDEIIQQYRGLFPETPYEGVDSGPGFRTGGYCSQAEPRATFAAMVSRLDLYVGQIMEKLKELQLEDNTLIVFTSDNGPHQEGGADPDFFNSNGIYRGYKRDLYEGGIRVPMIVQWNNRVEAGTESGLICTFWDMMPTFAEVTGSALGKTDGVNLLPTLLNKGNQRQHEYIYFEFLEMGGRQAVRKGNWKLLHLDIRNGGRYELYNLAADPSENHNIAGMYPNKVKELQVLMKSAHIEEPGWPLLNQ